MMDVVVEKDLFHILLLRKDLGGGISLRSPRDYQGFRVQGPRVL